ncbi:MAG: TonB-dependent receptor [Ignavibacterium sp.]
MKVINTFFYFFFLFFVLITLSFAQEKENKIVSNNDNYSAKNKTENFVSLEDALPLLEKKFNINFFYNDDLIKSLYLRLDDNLLKDQNIETILSSLLTPLQLRFSKLNNSTFVIFQDNTNKIVQPQEKSTIKGRILDSKGEPLPGVNIVAVGTNLGTTSDLNGDYQLSNLTAGKYLIRVSYVGYRTQELTITIIEGEIKIQDFKLEEDVLQMSQIVVTGTYQEREMRELSSSMMSIKGVELQNQPRNFSVADVLRTVPGIAAENLGEGGANIFVRGIPQGGRIDYLFLQENGSPVQTMPLALTGPDNIYRQDINVDRVEVVLGGNSIIYGSNRPGGIINFIDKTGGPVQKTTVRFSGAQYDMYRVDLNMNGPIGNQINYSIGGFYRYDRGLYYSGIPTEGYQIKGNLTKFFKDGYVRFYFKFMNDRVQQYVQIPHVTSTKESAIGERGTLNTDEVVDFAFQTPFGGQFVSSARNGIYANGEVGQIDLYKELGNGWILENKAKYSSFQHEFNWIIPNIPTPIKNYASTFIKNPSHSAVYSFAKHTGVPFTGDNIVQINTSNQYFPFDEFSNNLRITSDFLTGNMEHNFTVGLFASRTQGTDRETNTGNLVELASYPRLIDLKIVDSTGALVTQVTKNGIYKLTTNYVNSIEDVNVIAFFIGDEMKLGPFRLDAGFRYEREALSISQENTALYTTGTTEAEKNFRWGNGSYSQRKLSFDDWAVSIGINYAINQNINIYATGSRGYRMPQVYMFGNLIRDAQGNFVQASPDKNEQFLLPEIGIKYSSRIIGATVAFFYVNVKNRLDTRIQDLPNGTLTSVTENIGESRNYGVELTSIIAPPPIPGLRLNLSLTLQDPKFIDYKIPQGKGNFLVLDDLQPRRQPKTMLGAVLNYDRFNFDFNLSWKYGGDRYSDDANLLVLEGFHIFDLSFGYTLNMRNNQSVRLGVNANNIFNDRSVEAGDPRVPAGVDINARPFFGGRPILHRRIMGSITYNF